jgi:hypothetical protein
MRTIRAFSRFFSTPLKSRRWALLLYVLLIVGQVLLLNHVALHQLEEAIAPDNDHCSFCAVGSHAAPAIVPPLLPILTYIIVVYLTLGTTGVVGFDLPVIRVRGPPPCIG